MKIHREFEQRTEEWHKAKLGKLSASRISPLMAKKGLGTGAHTLALEILSERLTGKAKYIFPTYAMQRGIELEGHALQRYVESNPGLEIENVAGIEDNGLWYSPDGIVGSTGLLEIKSPQGPQHIRNLMSNEVLAEYMPQLQFGLMVSGREWIDFISFNPDFEDKLAPKVIRVYPDENYIDLMKERIRQFNTIIESFLNCINN